MNRAQLSGGRRYVIVAITALAAVITPPDVISQLMLAVPMVLLFEGALAIMWLGERRASKAEAAEPAAACESVTAPPEG